MIVDSQNGIGTFVIYGLYEGMNMKSFNQYIIDSADMLAFWNHLPLLYIVKTKLTAPQITEKLRPFFDGRLFIVAEINDANIGGWLPKEAWTWFHTPAPLTKTQKPPEWLSGLLGAAKFNK